MLPVLGKSMLHPVAVQGVDVDVVGVNHPARRLASIGFHARSTASNHAQFVFFL